MDEGYSPSPRTFSRDLVNQVVARRPAGLQCLVQVRDAVADVVYARASLGKEFSNRTIPVIGSEQLDLAVSQGERHDGRAVGLLRGVRFETEHIAVKGKSRLEIFHGDADMSDAGVVGQRLSSSDSAGAVTQAAGRQTTNGE